ncbi:hypothetical protein [Thermoplasma acidophilum]|uniref:Transposase InsH N-terminal domain-containing protein n=1 Tax=Thermoplasma acidophilum (strain ATCC 25905 / DSM 1728 / JCM 9062 / NBRC 15155 / AMRC-C165) TaxID=273075 RepID=Q9HLF5_THEAC|nr:hypothetical protein [Thermoplasma acidophilum]CAC11418.1 hypothetical protein [Thermoplasma acidophilum]
MPGKYIPLIMDIIDNIVLPDVRKRKYTDRQIVKILILLQIFGISYRSSRAFLLNNRGYLDLVGIREIQPFQTLSRRSRKLDLHAINMEIASLYSLKETATMDSFKIHMQAFNCHEEKGMGKLQGS